MRRGRNECSLGGKGAVAACSGVTFAPFRWRLGSGAEVRLHWLWWAAGPRELRFGNWVLAATILGSSMAFIDGTVVNVALAALKLTYAQRSPMCSGWWKLMRCLSPRFCLRRVPGGPLRPAPRVHDRCRSFCSRLRLLWVCGGYPAS